MAELGEPLSEREMDVLNLLAQGSSNKEIAQALFISPNTVKVHLRRVYVKLGVGTRTEATVVALEQGLLALPGQEESSPEKSDPEPKKEEETEASQPLTGTEPEPATQEPVEEKIGEKPDQTAGTPNPQPQTSSPSSSLQLNRWLIGAVGILLVTVIGLLVWPDETVAPTPEPTLPPTAVPFADTQIDDSQWHETRPLPAPRTDASMIAAGPVLYLFGGITANGELSKEALAFDNNSKTWTAQRDKPTAVSQAATAELGGELYLLGGIIDTAGTPSAKVEVYSPSQNLWRAVPPLPEPLYGGVSLSSGGRIYYFGGHNGTTEVDSVYQFNGQDDWELVTTMPEAIANGNGGLIDQKVYIAGGSLDTGCHIYDLETTEWDTCTDMPTPRQGADSAVIQNKLYILGGTGESVGLIYTPSSDTWEAFENPLTISDGAAVANLETQLFFFGGERDGSLIPDGYRYAPLVYQWFIPAVSVESGDE